MSRKLLSRSVSRRSVLAGTAAGAAAAVARFPIPAIADTEPFRLGLLTVKTGPLAQGGIQMEQGVLTYLKETNYTIGGRTLRPARVAVAEPESPASAGGPGGGSPVTSDPD